MTPAETNAAEKTTVGEGADWVLGYGTNGFTEHALPDALDVMAAEGYRAVALTLGPAHFDPFADDWRERATALAADLRRRGFRVVVETGAPYALDPFHEFRPGLADREAGTRVALIERAIEIAAILDADCVSLWSGALPEDGMTEEEAWELMAERLSALLAYADERGVRVAIEPEPGMIVETVEQALRWRELVGAPAHLGITVDLGHCVAVAEPGGVAGALRRAGGLLFNVQIDDMMPGIHVHLALGDGVLDFTEVARTLDEIGYRGVAALELPQHSGQAPRIARESMRRLREARAQARPDWTADACAAVRQDASAVHALFAQAARRVGRAPLDPEDGTAFAVTAADEARAALVVALCESGAAAEVAEELYRRGDGDERRGVLRGLDALAAVSLPDEWAEAGDRIVRDALRTNDPRLVAAAMGRFAEARLDAAAWRQGVLKLVFMEVPLALVAGLRERADAELAAMAERFAAERRAAGRPVPHDLELLRTAGAER